MDISGYTSFVSGVTQNISNQLAPRSISASTVGATFITLANIVKDVADASYTKVEIDTKISLIPTGSSISEINADGKLLRGTPYTGYTSISGTSTAEGYYQRGTGTFVSAAGYYLKYFPASGNTDYYLSTVVPGDANVQGVTYFRSNGVFNGFGFSGIAGTDNNLSRRVITPPANTATIAVLSKNNTYGTIESQATYYQQPAYAGGSTKTLKQLEDAIALIPTGTTTGSTVQEIDTNGKIVRGAFYQTGNYVEVAGGGYPDQPGYRKYNTGALISTPEFFVKVYTGITAGTTYYVSTTVGYSDAAAVVWTRNNGTFAGFNQKGTGTDFTINKSAFVAPANAQIAYVFGQTQYGKLELPEQKYREYLPLQSSPFNLSFGILGDSNTAANDRWVARFQDYMSPANLHRVAVGSARWSKMSSTLNGVTYTTQNYDDPNFAGISDGNSGDNNDPVERQKRMNNSAVVHVQKFIAECTGTGATFPAPQAIVIMYGTNPDDDLGLVETAMSGKTISRDNTYTMVNAIRWCIQALMTAFPSCKIFMCTPFQIASPNLNETNRQKAELIKEMGNRLSIPVIDCFGKSGLNEKFEVTNSAGRYFQDGKHLNYDGGILIGRFIANEVKVCYI